MGKGFLWFVQAVFMVTSHENYLFNLANVSLPLCK